MDKKYVTIQLEIDRKLYLLILEACLKTHETIEEFIIKACEEKIASDRAKLKPKTDKEAK